MEKAKNLSSFDNWHAMDVAKLLNVRLGDKTPVLEDLILREEEIPDFWKGTINFFRRQLEVQYSFWNEAELSRKFIIPFFTALDWFSEDSNSFHGRPLKGEINGYKVNGIVDGMVASGSYEPHKPYFILQEYKRMQRGESDPLGQLLIAMLVAREHNHNKDIIYGCYVIGTYWRFVIIEGDEYCQSQGFDATDENEITIIWSALNKIKRKVFASVTEENKK